MTYYSDDVRRKAYINYVHEILKTTDILKEKGFNDYNYFLEYASNLKNFIVVEDKNRNIRNKLFKALKRETLPNHETVYLLGTTLGITPDFYTFEMNLKSGIYKEFIDTTQIKISTTASQIFKHEFFTLIPKQIEPANNADIFYDGFPPDWNEIEANFDFPREQYLQKNGIRDSINSTLKHLSSPKFQLIKGVGGTGKTTLLKRIAYDISRDIPDVYYLDTTEKNQNELSFFYEELFNLLTTKIDKKIIITINGLLNLIKPINFLKDEKMLREFNNYPILFIVTEHNSNYNYLKLNYRLPHFEQIFELGKVTEGEIDSIFQKINTLEANSQLSKIHRPLSDSTLKILCLEGYGRHLIVILMQIRRGKQFIEIIKDECIKLESLDTTLFSSNVYYLICLINKLNFKIPDEMIFHSLQKDLLSGYKELKKYCAGIINDSGDFLQPRHKIIANEVYNIQFYGNNKIILASLKSIFNLNPDTGPYKEMLIETIINCFSIKNQHKYVIKTFNRDVETIRKFYLHFDQFEVFNKKFRKLFYSSLGYFEHHFNNLVDSVQYFTKAIESDKSDSAIYRILSYNYFSLNQLSLCYTYANLAFQNSKNEEDKYESVIIMTFSNFENFLKAKPLFNELANSKNKKIKKAYNEYIEVYNFLMRNKTEAIDANQFEKIQLKWRRPQQVYLLSHFIKQDENEQSEKNGFVNQTDFNYDFDQLNELREKMDQNSEENTRAYFYRLLANALKKKFESMIEIINISEINDFFELSINLNYKDSFTHNYYGTFLKDVFSNYNKAEHEYRIALDIGNESPNKYYHNHPKFLNDLALLLLLQFEKGLKNREALNEAELLLINAVEEIEKRKDFIFPFAKENLIEIQLLLSSNKNE